MLSAGQARHPSSGRHRRRASTVAPPVEPATAPVGAEAVYSSWCSAWRLSDSFTGSAGRRHEGERTRTRRPRSAGLTIGPHIPVAETMLAAYSALLGRSMRRRDHPELSRSSHGACIEANTGV